MKKSTLMAVWAVLFALCAGLGLIPEPEGVLRSLLTALSVLFFVPGFLLLRQAKTRWDGHTVRLVRNFSALSLLLTLVLLVLNVWSVAMGEMAGLVLYYMLVILSSPMVCSGFWALSLFLWACLLIYSCQLLKKH